MKECLIWVAMSSFAGIAAIGFGIPSPSGQARAGWADFEIVKVPLSTYGMTMCQGTIVDASLIAALSSTKNKAAEARARYVSG